MCRPPPAGAGAQAPWGWRPRLRPPRGGGGSAAPRGAGWNHVAGRASPPPLEHDVQRMPIGQPSSRRPAQQARMSTMKTKSELLKDARAVIPEVTPAELSRQSPKPVLLDVREKQ